MRILKPLPGTLPMPERNIVGDWHLHALGDRVFDLAGHNLNGICTGSYSWGPGRFGSAWEGDGGSDQIQIISAESAGGILNPAAITIVAWVKTNTGTEDQDIVSSWRVGVGANQSYLLWIDEPVWEWIVQTGAGNDVCNSLFNVVPNIWTQAVGTYDGVNTLRLYINAILVSTNATAIGALDTNISINNVYIAARAPGGGAYKEFDGQIDHVRIYDYALTLNEIERLYRESFYRYPENRCFAVA